MTYNTYVEEDGLAKLPWEKKAQWPLASDHLYTFNVSPRTTMGVAHQQLASNFAISFDYRLAQLRLRASKS